MENTTHTNQEATYKNSLHPVIYRLFRKRNFDNQMITDFLSWDLKLLPDLTSLKDMKKCALRIVKAMDSKEKIGIWGDYDVDGTTSCAVFYHFFKMHDIEVELLQPSRFVEGYGIHPSSIDKSKGLGIELLITVDCGITNNEAAEYAKEVGLDLIITDHHTDAREEMPPAYAVVNPNRRDEPENSPLRPLAGVGVAFAVCLEVRKILLEKKINAPSIYPLLQFVAIGTICDLAKLTPMNLKLVRHGLKQIKDTEYAGLKAFFSPEERQIGFVPSEKLSFNIGPMINSKGRLEHAEKALDLLKASDSDEAFQCYSHLEISNNERKFIQAEVFNEAKEQMMSNMHQGPLLVCIVYAPHWHEGVIGIVASKLVETFKVPAIVFSDAQESGIIKASARSAGELSIFNCLNNCSELLTKFGGHKAAAGLSMPKEELENFTTSVTDYLKNIPAIERTVQDYYDLEITAEEINPKLVKELEMLEPFGMGNEKPLFKMKNFKLNSFDLLKDVHVRWNISSNTGPVIPLKGISFNYIGKWNCPHPEEIFEAQQQGEEICAYFTLGINRFRGNEYIQLMINKITIGEI